MSEVTYLYKQIWGLKKYLNIYQRKYNMFSWLKSITLNKKIGK